ncbi:MAG TPA: hypothetical protein VD813_13790 [Pseudonocardia sp.]|nr:hypothetical protein [Pseudonocardia sp.]
MTPTWEPDPGSEQDSPATLVNPYLSAAGRRGAVRGVALGSIGAAAGVVAVAAMPAGAQADDPSAGTAEIWLGSAVAVEQEISRQSMPVGYLWASPPGDEPEGSPVLLE